MNSFHKRFLCLSASLLGAVTAPAGLLYNLDDTVLDGTVGENTFVTNTANGAGLSYDGGIPALTQTLTGSGAFSYSAVYFNATSLTSIGDSIKVTYAFTPSSALAFNLNDAVMRVGFFNSGATKLTSNLAGFVDTTFSGDTGYAALYRPRTGTVGASNTFAQRNASGGTQDNLWDSGTRTQFAGPTLNSPGTGAVSGSFTLTLVSTGVELTSAINSGANQSFIDTVTPFTTFDSFSFFGLSGATSQTLAFSNLTVAFTPVPEPSSVVLAGLAGAFLIFARRQRA